MKFRLICVGKLSEAWIKQGVEEYQTRLQRYFPLETVELKEEKGGRKGDSLVLMRREGQRILEKIPPQAYVVALDERGKGVTSEQLAQRLEEQMLHGGRDWCLVIGGAFGLDQEVKKRADLLLSLSGMTFTHQMARLFLLEQLYRSSTILKNEPYHNR